MLNSVKKICQVTKGKMVKGNMNQKITGIMSRCASTAPGQIYFDVKGGPGGNSNILTALKKGATALVVSKHKKKLPFEDSRVAVIAVDNVVKAFWDCVTYHRDQFDIPIVGVTGTSGKTTTKEMVASILRCKWRKVLKTTQNLNLPNYVPNHLMRLSARHRAAVFEIGMCLPGHIGKQTVVIKPRIGIITNIGQGHVGNFGSKEGVIAEKASIAKGIPEDGYLLLNADDLNTKKADFSFYKGKIITFGIDNKADFVAKDIRTGQDEITFSTTVYGKVEKFRLPVSGRHNVYNALAAIAASSLLGVEIEKIREGLSKYRRPSQRLQLVKGIRDTLLINDTYNANPDSVIAGLEVLRELSEGKVSVAVLGNMLEQGVFSTEAHRRVGQKVHQLGINYLVTVGWFARQIAEGAINAGMDPRKVISFDRRYQASFYLKKHLPKGSVCLFKSSRAVYLDQSVEYLREKENQ